MVLAHDLNTTQRTRDIRTNQDVLFDALLLSEKTLLGLNEAGFFKPSPVQLHGIPMGKCGFDLLLEAKSGTGKTIVFTVIAFEKIDLQKGLQTIILAPTREIASQICDVIKTVGVQYSGLCVEVVMGGLPLKDDINKFKKGNNVHIVVGSPGRLRHLIQDNYIDTSSVRLLVLDEADKLIEKSFQADINFIFASLPAQKQVVMSSATFSESAKEFISNYVKEPQHICPDSTSVLLGIEQKVSLVSTNTNIVKQTQIRYEELIKILTHKDFKQCLIFCNYQARIADLYKLLTRDKWPCEQLYGLQQQTDRLDALKTLQEYKCRILISTDLAARGIDASNVDLVINFEPPYEWQTYLHRIGRAGRYGSYGTAVSIVSVGKEEVKFKEILSIMHESLNISYYWKNTKYVLTNNNHGESQYYTKPQNTDTLKINSKPEKIPNGAINHKIKENNEIIDIINGDTHENNGKSEKIPDGATNNNVEENNEIIDTNGAANESMFEYLWGQDNNNNNAKVKIENFNDLANSYNDSQSINKFDDLLQSLEDHDSTKQDVVQELKLIQINTQHISKCINQLNKSHEKPNIPSKKSLCQDDKNDGEIMEHNIPNGDIIECEESKNILYEINKKGNEVNEPYISNQITNSNDESDKILNEEQSEMIRLGLPLSFFSKEDKYADNKQTNQKKRSKTCNYAKLENNRPNIRENSNIDNTTKKCIANTNRSEKSYLLEDSKQSHKKAAINDFNKQRIREDIRKSTEECINTKKSIKWDLKQPEISKPQYENRAKTNEKPHHEKVQRDVSKNNTKGTEKSKKVNAKERSEDEYTLWYNAMKLRTMQLEQLFYLEEMSQII